jgi:TRAP-type uncharacterized transport system substrate-binding protein
VLKIATGKEHDVYDEIARSIANIQLLKDKEVDLAFVQSDWVYKWLHGRGGAISSLTTGCNTTGDSIDNESTSAPPPSFPDVRVVRPLYPAHLQVFARRDIETLESLTGKRVAIGLADSASQFHARLLLATAGVKGCTSSEPFGTLAC